ncbi:MAG: extracellular solute-binding protein, partial [Ruminiclostridium sp.]|nr:extracellular solute-binding protein [Ruminiclostridium sp.]
LTKSLNKFYQQGALVPIEQSWIDASTNVKNIPADYWTVVRKSGKILSVPYRSMQKLALFIRQDWLDKLGLKVPVTIDDWYNVSRAFALNDPDGNGKQDTYGYAGQNEWDTASYFFQPIQNAIVKYTSEITYDRAEDKLKFVPFEEDYKTYLEFLQKSYKEKIIEPNIFTNKEDNMRNLFFSGKTGIISDYVDLVDDDIAKTTAVNPNAKITLFSPPTGSQGSGFFAFLSDLSIGILKSTRNPEATFKYFIDPLHSLEGQQLLVYGPEGVNWKKGADGKAVATVEKYTNGLMPFLVINQDKFQPILPMSDPTKLSLDLFSKSLKYANYNIAPLNPKWDEMYGQFLEYYAKIITGKLEVNAGVEEWKQKFNEKGFNQYFDDANKDTSWAK